MVYANDFIYIEVHESEIPWLKIFSQKPCKEMSECDEATKRQIYKCLDIVEKTMIAYYNPTKINIASFGNYLPRLHWHIMARFKEDSHYPEPMWGKKQRESKLDLPPFEKFIKLLQKELKERL